MVKLEMYSQSGVDALAREPGPLVVPDSEVVGPICPDELNLFLAHLCIGGGLGFPEDLLSNREVSPLLSGEVAFDEGAVGASKVVDAVGEIFPDVDLAVRVRDLVDNLHRLAAQKASLGRCRSLAAENLPIPELRPLESSQSGSSRKSSKKSSSTR